MDEQISPFRIKWIEIQIEICLIVLDGPSEGIF